MVYDFYSYTFKGHLLKKRPLILKIYSSVSSFVTIDPSSMNGSPAC